MTTKNILISLEDARAFTTQPLAGVDTEEQTIIWRTLIDRGISIEPSQWSASIEPTDKGYAITVETGYTEEEEIEVEKMKKEFSEKIEFDGKEEALWLLSFITEGGMGVELVKVELVSVIYAVYHILNGNDKILSMVKNGHSSFTQLTDDLIEIWKFEAGKEYFLEIWKDGQSDEYWDEMPESIEWATRGF